MGQNPGVNYLTSCSSNWTIFNRYVNQPDKNVEIMYFVCISPYCAPLRLSAKDLHLYYHHCLEKFCILFQATVFRYFLMPWSED